MERLERVIFYSLILLLPTQLGKHFWPDFTIVSGIRIDYLSPTLYITDILLILLFAFTFLHWMKTVEISKFTFHISKQQFKNKIFIGSFILLFLLSNTVFALRPLLSFYGLAKLGEFVFFGWYIVKTVRYHFQLQDSALLFAISSLFESLLAIAQYIHQGSLNGIFYYFGERAFTGTTPGIANADIGGILVLRPYGTFSHPNVLAGFLLISLVIAWSLLLTAKKRWMRVIGIVSLLIGSIALLLTFSRVVILLWGILLVGTGGRLVFRSLKTLPGKVLFITVVIIGLIAISFIPVVHDILLRFSQTSLSDESVTEREELLSTAFTMIRQHPLFGVGLYNFIPAMAPLQKPMPLGLYLQPVHNIFVLVFAETGIVGEILFLWLLITIAFRIKHHILRIKGTLVVLLLIILVTGMFDHYWLTLQQGQLLFAYVIGLCFALMHDRKKVS